MPDDEVTQWMPYGGATTFAALDDWSAAMRVRNAVESTIGQFNTLLSNIGGAPITDVERYEKAQALVEELADRLEAVQANPDLAFKEGKVPIGGLVGFFMDRFQAAKEKQETATTDPQGTFTAYKDDAGVGRWVTIHTNKFRDRDREIFTEKAHRDYVARVEASGEYPELQLWHTPLPIGRADFLAYDDRGFTVASGTYLPGFEEVGDRLAEMSKSQPLGCSHGFKYDRLDRLDGVFEWYHTQEVTVLPLQRAANLLTSSAPLGIKESEMLTPEKAEFLAQALGPEGAKMLETSLAELANKAAEAGLDFKEAGSAAVAEPPAAVVAPPAEPATTTSDATIVQVGSSTVVPADPPRNEAGEVIVESGTIAADGTLVPDATPQARIAEPEAPEAAAPAEAAPVEEAKAAVEPEAPPAAPFVDETIPEAPQAATPGTEPPPPPLDLAGKDVQFLTLLKTALGEALTPIESRLGAIERKQAEHDETIAAVKETTDRHERGMDSAIADAMTPVRRPPVVAPASTTGPAPTDAQVAVIVAGKEEAAKEGEPDPGVPDYLAPYLGTMAKAIPEA